MVKTDFIKLYEELSILNEAKADIDNFVNKFGEDTYDLFKKSTQRLKNNGISTDLTYHTKHTDKKDLVAILINLQNRAITKDDNLTKLAGDYEYLGEGKGYKVYKINDVVASMNLGAGTGWCISGRYGHYGEKNYTPTRATAEEHWNSYTEKGIQFYFFIGNNDKVALAVYPKSLSVNQVIGDTYLLKTNCEVYDERDNLSYSLLPSLPVDLVGTIIFDGAPEENGLYIKDNVLLRCNKSKNLESVVIPDSVIEIANQAFAQCERLTSITIPSSVTNIGDTAFYHCSNLTSVTFEENSQLTSIDSSAFSNCTSLTSIALGENSKLTTIGSYAFCNCTSLTSITIPDSVTTIGDDAFYNCSSLTSVTFGDSVTSTGNSAFRGCTSLKSIVIPDSVTTIGNHAFYRCTSLTSITIPHSVTSIGNSAFGGCTNLTSITIPDSVTTIGWAAFSECTSLTSITIPDSVTELGEYAFYGCTSLTNIVIDKNNPNYKVVNDHLYDKSGKKIA